MPSITVSDNITFHYTDSGPLDQNIKIHTTIITLHGHSFHSGIFARILPLAKLHGFRIMCIARRGYLGSTPYSPEEKKILDNGTTEQQNALLTSQGVLLGLVIDGIIQRYALPEAGGIALLGWSMGSVFTMALLAAVHDLPKNTKERLKKYIHTCICWDAPSVGFGMSLPEESYSPLWDLSLSPGERSATFGIWASGYFHHGELSTKEFSELNQRDFDTHVRKPTITKMTDQEINSVFDGPSGMEYDTPIVFKGIFDDALSSQSSKALFDPKIRKEWGRLKITFMYAQNTLWLVIFAMWKLEERAKQAGIDYESVNDANHFMMWDEPDRFMVTLKKIISTSQPDA